MRRLLMIAGFALCLLMVFALLRYPPALAAEKKEVLGPISTIVSGSVEMGNDLVKAIRENTGIKVYNQCMSAEEVYAKLKAEAPNFSADMVLALSGAVGHKVQKQGWMVSYDSPTWRGESKIWKDPNGEWVNTGNWGFVLLGNKDLLAEKGWELPDSYDDLLDPKWKGKIILPSPVTSGTAYLMVYSFMTVYGFNKGLKGRAAEEAGWEYLEKLDKNVPYYTRSGSAPNELVGRGEYIITLGGDYAITPKLKMGYPLIWKEAREGVGYVASYAFILKGSKHVAACQKVIDLFGTAKGSKLWNGMGFMTKDKTLVNPIYGKSANYIPDLRTDWAFANKDRIIREWKERFLLKQQK